MTDGIWFLFMYIEWVVYSLLYSNLMSMMGPRFRFHINFHIAGM